MNTFRGYFINIPPKLMKPFTCFILMVFTILTSCENEDVLIAQCEIPNNISATNITYNSVDVGWNYSNTNATFIVEIGLNGFTQGTGNSINAATNALQINGLMANTTYQVYVKANCDVTNESLWSEALNFTTLAEPVVAEFRQNLSDLNLFSGTLNELNPSIYAFEYKLNTALFTDYAYKQRLIALPQGASMTYDGDGLPIFPDNTVIAKTFYYYNDERNPDLGKHIIETRILMKLNGEWQTGDYKWNEDATDAVLDPNGSEVPVAWVDATGTQNQITYKIPSNTDCFTCHNNYNVITPIGPKLRTLNFDINGSNQLQKLIDNNQLEGLDAPTSVAVLPNWEDPSISLEARARAYLDMNCAHCHIPGGFCDTLSDLDLDYATTLDNSKIIERKFLIIARMNAYIPGFSMPYIGTVSNHTEGVDLVFEYLDTL